MVAPVNSAVSPVAAALADARRRLISVAVISGTINLLTLSGSIYMLQVYDRVLPSRNLSTLVGLSVIVLAAYLLQGYLDSVRTRMLGRIAGLFDAALQEPIYGTLVDLPLKGMAPATVQQPMRDLELVRVFLSGMGPTAFLDMPWLPIFVIALFLFHPVIGLAAVFGAAMIVSVALLAEHRTKTLAKTAVERGARRAGLADVIRRNAEAIHALGMRGRFMSAWCRLNESHIAETTRMRDVEADIGAVAKVLRYVLQSAVLGIGAALVVGEHASGGIMIASSIMMGRALAPIEIVLGTWKQLVSAREAVKRLGASFCAIPAPSVPAVALPSPTRHLAVQHLSVAPPGCSRLIARNISFVLSAGTGLALLGASGSGKSSLAKALVGIWPSVHGHVRLDGARLDQWDKDALGRHIGYLPQEVSLFDGTVADNICRFEERPGEDRILEAAMIAGAHGLILSLPKGYATSIGEGGALLSAGQRQRLGLARALYGRPFLVVLDEPNANLDAEGEAALTRAIKIMRERGAIVIVISHRPSALAALNMLLVLHNGGVLAFGERDKVFAHFAQRKAAMRPLGEAPASRTSLECRPT
jgi:PrtD family type I secretion system ABC transporter